MPPFSDQSAPQPATASGKTATLACPDCRTTLQTAADQSVEAPCPVCGQMLRYEAPTRAKLAHFRPLRHYSRRFRPRKQEEPGTRHTRHHHLSLHRRLHQANEFLNTRTGMLRVGGVLCFLLVICVILFIKQDARRRAAELRRHSPPAERGVPPAPAAPIVPVNLPPVEQAAPSPDPFALSPDQVIEAGQPEE